jgi:Cd2+/Zn2+-exporting ATPase
MDVEGKVTHTVALGGEIYSDAYGAVATLRASGEDVFLATGNCKQSSLRCARLLGIPKDFVIYDADPSDKREFIKKLRNYYGFVIMVGNDINDLDAMGEADLGVLIKRPDEPSAGGLGKSAMVDYVLHSLHDIIGIVRQVKESLPRNTGPGTRDACAGER